MIEHHIMRKRLAFVMGNELISQSGVLILILITRTCRAQEAYKKPTNDVIDIGHAHLKLV